jgi:hypothetical protein
VILASCEVKRGSRIKHQDSWVILKSRDMPYKDPEVRKLKAREYSAKHYAANREKARAAVARNKALYREQWRAFKATLSCVVCGVSHSDLLDFHHLPRYRNDPDKMAVNYFIGQCRFARAYEEVKKCVPLCANCHRLGHFLERDGMPERPSGLLLAIAQYFVIPGVSDDNDSG